MSFKQFRRKVRKPFETGACLFLFAIIRLMTLKGVRRTARIFGFILYLLPAQRKLVMANLDVAFPDKTLTDKKRIARKSMANLLMAFMEQIWFYQHEKRQKRYLTQSDEIISKIKELEKEQSILFLALHMGNWEFTSLTANQFSDKKLSIVARRVKNSFLNDWITKAREFTGAKVLLGNGAVKSLLRALKGKENIGLLVDQNTKTYEGGVFGNFFELPVTISRTPAMLARKFDCRIVLLNCLRNRDGFYYDLRVIEKSSKEFESDLSLSQEFLKEMEGLVRQFPESWIWMYNRWNYIPQDMLHLQDKYPYYAKINEE